MVITAYPEDGVRERALTAGVIVYLNKPVEQMICLLASARL
jgi:CheY-like chemotaxis protein